MQKLAIFGLALYTLLLLFTRFYNVGYTARFTQDESGFLVRAHQIYEERKLTLIGQVNEQGKVFGSLSIYMLLPFAFLGDFDPRAMFYGAAFWGGLTSTILLILVYKINSKMLIPAALLTIFWFPLLQTGRWAWNPNFVPFWIGLGIFFYLQQKNWGYILTGICLGLAVHHHYYAIFAGGFFALLAGIELLIKRQPIATAGIWGGFFATLLPFVIFDLRHPPGLFFRGASTQGNALSFTTSFWSDTGKIFDYFIQADFLIGIVIFLFALLIVIDLKQRSKALLFLAPIFFQRIMLSLVAPYFFHYYLAIIPFLIFWLAYPRKELGRIISSVGMWILIFGSLFQVIPLLTRPPVVPDLPTQVVIADTIKQDLVTRKLKNVNVAVLASDDHDVQADKYRDILLGRDSIHFDTHDEYFHSDHLYVISSSDEQTLRQDPAPEIANFRTGPLQQKFPIAKTEWFVYHFSRN